MLILFTLILCPVALLWEAFALQLLWAWFVVPMFGAAALTLGQAIGLSLVTGLLTHQRPRGEEEDAEASIVNALAWAVFFPAVSIAIGWLAK